jgi:hypothetical protein
VLFILVYADQRRFPLTAQRVGEALAAKALQEGDVYLHTLQPPSLSQHQRQQQPSLTSDKNASARGAEDGSAPADSEPEVAVRAQGSLPIAHLAPDI